jgi:hypothetical protein
MGKSNLNTALCIYFKLYNLLRYEQHESVVSQHLKVLERYTIYAHELLMSLRNVRV